MHGLIFVTWEKFLSDRFGKRFLQTYRTSIGETIFTAPLASRVYDDTAFLTGVESVCQLTGLPADMLLREYGCYFILNGLTRSLCSYLLSQVYSGKELLLVMSQTHHQLRRTPDGLTPPLFRYEAPLLDQEGFILVYESSRKVCPLLLGAIKGAAALYGEGVHVVEHTCMQKGASACRFEVHFFPLSRPAHFHQETSEQRARLRTQRFLAELVFAVLPEREGATLRDLQVILRSRRVNPNHLRPSVLLGAIQHLQYVGLAASTANQPGDGLLDRRYWRVPPSGAEQAR